MRFVFQPGDWFSRPNTPIIQNSLETLISLLGKSEIFAIMIALRLQSVPTVTTVRTAPCSAAVTVRTTRLVNASRASVRTAGVRRGGTAPGVHKVGGWWEGGGRREG